MISLGARGLEEVRRIFDRLGQDQMHYAAMIAVNNTAFSLLPKSRQHLAESFDRPTPLIKGATRVKKASKETLTAIVYIDPKRAPIIKTHELGGDRGDQLIERLLKGKGWLPSGWRAVPSSSMSRDAYGNPKRSEVNLIVNELSAGISGNKASNRRCFVIPVGSSRPLQPGVYRTKSRAQGLAVMLLYIFVSRSQYRAILGWETAMQADAIQVLPTEAEKAVRRAIETAR